MTARPVRFLVVGCGAVLLLAVGVLVWWVWDLMVLMGPGGELPVVTLRQVEAPGGAILVEARLSSEAEGYRLSEIVADRTLAEALGLSAPDGFVEEPMPLSDREKRDPDTVAWASEWNRENLRWTGAVPIRADESVLLRFAAASPTAASGLLRVSYEWKLGLGGGSAEATVTLNESATASEDESLVPPDEADRP